MKRTSTIIGRDKVTIGAAAETPALPRMLTRRPFASSAYAVLRRSLIVGPEMRRTDGEWRLLDRLVTAP